MELDLELVLDILADLKRLEKLMGVEVETCTRLKEEINNDIERRR